MQASRTFHSSLSIHSQLACLALGTVCLMLGGCAGASSTTTTTVTPPVTATQTPLTVPYALTGAVSLVHDPAIIREGSTYYVLSTDPGGSAQVGNLPILCSTDKVNWTRCGQVFNAPPPEVLAVFPTLTVLWAPDVSYFNGLYHVYYAASGFGANHSLIGLATSPTMNPSDPNYKWTDQGIVLSSQTTDNFNAIDPSVLVDTDSSGNVAHVWLAYGSFWGGIYERELNPTSGMLSASNTTVVNLATRPGVTNDPIEGSSLVQEGGYYYLFVSFGYCCDVQYTQDTYQIAVGRSTSPTGPFVDESGTAMTSGGGTVLLSGNTTWYGPGGGTMYVDPTGGDTIAFHALSAAQNGLDFLFVNSVTWSNGWPTITAQQ